MDDERDTFELTARTPAPTHANAQDAGDEDVRHRLMGLLRTARRAGLPTMVTAAPSARPARRRAPLPTRRAS